MSSTMAKESKKKKSEATEFWNVSLKLDPEFEQIVNDYMNSPLREHTPTLKQTFQRALKLLQADDVKLAAIRKKMEEET